MVFLERRKEGHRQSDEHWNRFKGDVGETSERRGGAHMGFIEGIDTILKRNGTGLDLAGKACLVLGAQLLC